MEAERRRAAQKRSTVLPSRAPVAPQARVAGQQPQAGNQLMQLMLSSGALQAKPSVSQPGDSFEQEADRVADQVMRMPAQSAAAAPQVQLKCAQCEDEMTAQRFAVGDESELILKKPAGGAQSSPGAESQVSVRSALQNGQPLAPAARSFLEPRFGRDLGHVSVHSNEAAADSARALNARAYTVGSDIAFASGEYQPGTREGQRLLAHEITHTFQQGEGAASQRQIQRTIGDGHDLTSTRFSGDAVLEGCFDNQRVVKRTSNNNGAHVRLLQQSLIDMGYTLPGFGVDGIFGKETEAAVKMFQADAGAVLVDGEVGPETMGLFDRHDTQTPGGIGPPQRTGPVPGPLPAPAATCDTPYTGVTFTLANQIATGISPAATIAIVPGGTSGLMLLRGLAPANYVPDVTINAPTDAVAQGFQVGFASNILSDFVEYFYSSATVVAAAVPAAKDGVGLASGNYDPVFVTGPTAGLLENFAANGDTRHLVWPDAPRDAAFVSSSDNAECGPGVTAGTLVTAAMIDTFRTWVVARHRASGCTRALHHIDWDINWQAIINTNAAGISTATVVSNVLNVTEPDGDGQIPFIQGGQVANDINAAHRNCT